MRKTLRKIRKYLGTHARGFSLLEVLVSLCIFAILSVMTTRALFLTLKTTQRVKERVALRDDMAFALDVMKKSIRNADEVGSCGGGSCMVDGATWSLGTDSYEGEAVQVITHSEIGTVTPVNVNIDSLDFQVSEGVDPTAGSDYNNRTVLIRVVASSMDVEDVKIVKQVSFTTRNF